MPPSKNESLLRTLVSEADSLGSRVSKNQFPVLLRPIGEIRKVTSVDFCPLLVDAMLTTHSGGFRILLNSDGGRVEDLKERYNNETRGRMLLPRLRFSIAHELAHTFFYDIKQEHPKLARKFTAGGGLTELENLERHCNTIASHMLLPTKMLSDEFYHLNVITPESVLGLAQKAGVSLQAFLWRLNKFDSLFIKRFFRGCVVLVRQNANEWEIQAIAKPTGLNIARQLSIMSPGDVWKLKTHDGIELFPNLLPSISTAALSVESQQSKNVNQYKICVTQVGNYENNNSYLLTFEELFKR